MVTSYRLDLYSKIKEYRPSRALSSAEFTYIWNGWADGTTGLPNSMLGEFSMLLRNCAATPDDKTYPDYKQRGRFIKFRASEELYDTVKDPGCLKNLVSIPEYQGVIRDFRKQMALVLESTGDHELKNYRAAISRVVPQ
jgi:hypothetical protein